jgi:Hg(II)-responsive transcriptional regulator
VSAFTIGQLARQAGVAVETIRFYERRGLLKEPARLPSGYREYSPESAARLRFILVAKQLGFSLREVRELLQIREGTALICSEVRRRVEAKISSVAEQIECLGRIKNTLETLLDECKANRLPTECPLLDALSRRVEPSLSSCCCCEPEGSDVRCGSCDT